MRREHATHVWLRESDESDSEPSESSLESSGTSAGTEEKDVGGEEREEGSGVSGAGKEGAALWVGVSAAVVWNGEESCARSSCGSSFMGESASSAPVGASCWETKQEIRLR